MSVSECLVRYKWMDMLAENISVTFLSFHESLFPLGRYFMGNILFKATAIKISTVLICGSTAIPS